MSGAGGKTGLTRAQITEIRRRAKAAGIEKKGMFSAAELQKLAAKFGIVPAGKAK
jgi:hypothetical protein